MIYSDWGLGIGDWGLGIGDWGLGPIPNPQSPKNILIFELFIIETYFILIFKLKINLIPMYLKPYF